MISKLHIKVCGMKSVPNRKALEELPVDYFGFVFYPGSPRYAGPVEEAVKTGLFDTYRFTVGVFVDSPVTEVIRTARKCNLTHIQLHGQETAEYCRQVKEEGFRVIRSFAVHPEINFDICRDFAAVSDFFLFDTKGKLPGGTGEKFNWEILRNYNLLVPFFLSGGISPGDEPDIAAFSHPMLYAIDLNSGFEDAPGVKNVEKLKFFLKKLSNVRMF